MGLRPAHTIRTPGGQVWSRISQHKPRKSYVKGAPHPKIRRYKVGNRNGNYEIVIDLVSKTNVQLRDNAVEAARATINNLLSKKLLDKYYFRVLRYPHLVLREHAALGVAGADRISSGMKHAFGRPKGRLVMLKKGASLFRIYVAKSAYPIVKTALKRASIKLSGTYSINVSPFDHI